MKDSKEWVGRYFQRFEFDCPCDNCTRTPVDSGLIARWDRLRHELGRIVITSGYRCPAHNRTLHDIGAAKDSYHMDGMAGDGRPLDTDIKTLRRRAYELYHTDSGIGFYDNRIHIDSRGTAAFWDKRTSTPGQT